MSDEQAVAPDGSVPPQEIDTQLAILNHYVYTHQNTGPDSEIWKCVAYVEHLARLGALVERMLPGMILEREGWGKDCWNARKYEGHEAESELCETPSAALRDLFDKLDT